MKVVVVNHITLDGVMQSPGRPDEDLRDGFAHGGWATSTAGDPVLLQAVGEQMSPPSSAMLLGRRSYDDMLSAWNARGGPFKDGLNNMKKFVASGNPATKLAWPNSTLLHGDVPAAVAELRQRDGGNLVIMGSGVLIRSLLPHGLIDRYLLMIHPLVLGSGQKLFGDQGHDARLKLTGSVSTDTGVIVATYEPA